MIKKPNSNDSRQKRHKRVRKNISGTAGRPRLNVFRSLSNIYGQLIDDVSGVTLVSASSLDKDFDASGSKQETARKVGEAIAKKALSQGIEEVVFDRGGYLYHGRVKEFADGARAGGLKF